MPLKHLPIYVLLNQVNTFISQLKIYLSLFLSALQHSIRTAKVFKPNLLLSKHRNIKVQDGQWVEKDTVLTLQNNLVLYPGENVRQFNEFFLLKAILFCNSDLRRT